MGVAFFIGAFLFFWLIGAAYFKNCAAGIVVPIGVAVLGFIAFFLLVSGVLLDGAVS